MAEMKGNYDHSMQNVATTYIPCACGNSRFLLVLSEHKGSGVMVPNESSAVQCDWCKRYWSAGLADG